MLLGLQPKWGVMEDVNGVGGRGGGGVEHVPPNYAHPLMKSALQLYSRFQNSMFPNRS